MSVPLFIYHIEVFTLFVDVSVNDPIGWMLVTCRRDEPRDHLSNFHELPKRKIVFQASSSSRGSPIIASEITRRHTTLSTTRTLPLSHPAHREHPVDLSCATLRFLIDSSRGLSLRGSCHPVRSVLPTHATESNSVIRITPSFCAFARCCRNISTLTSLSPL